MLVHFGVCWCVHAAATEPFLGEREKALMESKVLQVEKILKWLPHIEFIYFDINN